MWRLGGEFTFHLLSSLIYLVCLATLFSWVLIRSCKRGFRRRRHVYTENIVEKASDRRLSITRKGERPDLVRYRLRKAVVQSLFHGPTSSSFAEKSILLSGYLPEGGGDIVGLGMLTLKGHLVVSMKTDGGSLQRPTLGFYAPTDCIQPLIASVKATTGIISGLRSRIKAVSPLGFEIVHWMPVSSTKPLNMNNYENVLVAVGWPDTSGGNVLDRPDTPSVEILKLFQRNLVLSLSDVIILVLSRVNRSHLNSIHQIITQAHTMSKKILALHVNISEEEFQAQNCIIEGCLTIGLCKTNQQESSDLADLNYDHVRMTTVMGRSGVLHCYSGQSADLNLSGVFSDCNLTYSLPCLPQHQKTVSDILSNTAMQVGIPDRCIIKNDKMEGGSEFTVAVEM